MHRGKFRNLAVWIFVAAVTFALPFVVRPFQRSAYVATIKLFPVNRVGVARRRTDIPYAQHLLNSEPAREELRTRSAGGVTPTSRDVALFGSTARGAKTDRLYRTVSARVAAATSSEADTKAINVMIAIEYASTVDLQARARRLLTSKSLSRDSATRAYLRQFLKDPQPRFVIKHLPTVVREDDPAVVARVVSDFRARPASWAVGSAGLLLTLALWVSLSAPLPPSLARSRYPRD